MQHQQWQDKAEEVQSYVDSHNAREVLSCPKDSAWPFEIHLLSFAVFRRHDIDEDQVGLRERWAELQPSKQTIHT